MLQRKRGPDMGATYSLSTAVHWFRRDLRLSDNAALAAALEHYDQVLPVFVFDSHLLRGSTVSPARLALLLGCLEDLDSHLRQHGSHLVVRVGNPEEELPRLAQESGAIAVYFNRNYTPYARKRDAQVERRLRAQGLQVEHFQDAVLIEPGAVLTKAGTPYTVYTPFWRAWQEFLEAHPVQPVVTPLKRLRLKDARLLQFPSAPLAIPAGTPKADQVALWRHLVAGEAAGLARLKRFVDRDNPLGIAGYARSRDFPGLDATSRLSPFLKFGAVSIRTAYTLASAVREQVGSQEEREGIATWVKELAWREFYTQVLAFFPQVLQGAWRAEYAAVAWQHNERFFEAWRAGQTGYPLVDAGMRQLRSEGWMHNRVRMVVAMFLTRDLLLDWREGERYFMQQLIDGDLAANNGGWQWSASTGADAPPYFRIFNPINQSRRFDPEGTYIRRYVPELRQVPLPFLHTPWRMSPEEQRQANCQVGKEYPPPIVEHDVQRERAMALYRERAAQKRNAAGARSRVPSEEGFAESAGAGSCS
jgi:deoxyribodipyrimidine photo-lyase